MPDSLRRPPSLRRVLVATSLALLLLPLGGVVLLRLYESVLVRRTEQELIAQGAVIVPLYRQLLEERGALPAGYGNRVEVPPAEGGEETGPYRPVPPRLDLATDPVLPGPPAPRRSAAPPDGLARAAGAKLSPVLREAQRVTLAGIRVVDPGGTVVASTRGELGLTLAHREEVRRALGGETVSLLRERIRDEPAPSLDSLSRGTGVRVFVAMPVVDEGRVYGAVVLSRTPRSLLQSLYGIRWWILAGAAVLLLLVLVITALTHQKIARPVSELIDRARRVERGEATVVEPLERPGTRELLELSRALARMSRSLESRAEYIVAFAAGVSHEFKSPLASMRGAVELLQDHMTEMTAEEREQFLGNLEVDVLRLERLLDRLLLLARADLQRPGAEEAAVRPVLEQAADRARERGATVRVDAAAERVAVDGQTLATIIENLVDNAVQYGGEAVSIRLGARRGEDGLVEILVEDDGPGISPANAAKVFDRFFTTARESGGTGLGLSIVKALVEAHGGTVDHAGGGGGARFRVRLPRGHPGV